MKNKIRVCFIIYADEFAGAEKVVQDEIDYLNAGEFDTTLITSPLQAVIFRERLRKNIKICEVTIKRSFLKSLIDFKMFIKLYQVLKAGSFDVVSLHNNEAALYGGLVCLFLPHSKIFITEHNNLASPEIVMAERYSGVHGHVLKKLHLGSKLTFLLRHIINIRINGYIAVSAAVKNYIIQSLKFPGQKVTVLNNGINIDEFEYGFKKSRSLYQELQLEADSKLVGVVGRLSRQKGHIFLIEAAPRIIQSFPKVHFVFAGDGEERVHLEQRIKESGIEAHVTMLGFRKDVHEILKNLDVMVLPSLWEGLPMTVLECMASGVPVVASGVDGTLDIIDNGTDGFLVPPRDSAALADKIIAVLCDADMQRRFSVLGRGKIIKKFDVKERTRQLAAVFSAA